MSRSRFAIADPDDAGEAPSFGVPVAAFTDACEGSATRCPCSNVGAAGSGCGNSYDPSGARLTASGTPRVSDDTVVLTVVRLSPNTGALFVQSGSCFSTATAPAFGDGVRCMGTNIRRIATRQAIADSTQIGAEGESRVSVLGRVPASGGACYYQVFYRNMIAYCTSATINSSNAIRIDWIP